MSYIDDTCDGLLDKGLRIILYGSDYDIDSERLEEDIEFIQIPAWRMKDGKLIAIQDKELKIQ